MDLDTAVSLLAHAAARTLELVGIAVIVIGTVWAFGGYARKRIAAGSEGAYQALRMQLGRTILVGLELLVAADIIATVAIEPTVYNVGVLGLIILIRTFLSVSLEVEIYGHWPWQGGEKREPR